MNAKKSDLKGFEKWSSLIRRQGDKKEVCETLKCTCCTLNDYEMQHNDPQN